MARPGRPGVNYPAGQSETIEEPVQQLIHPSRQKLYGRSADDTDSHGSGTNQRQPEGGELVGEHTEGDPSYTIADTLTPILNDPNVQLGVELTGGALALGATAVLASPPARIVKAEVDLSVGTYHVLTGHPW